MSKNALVLFLAFAFNSAACYPQTESSPVSTAASITTPIAAAENNIARILSDRSWFSFSAIDVSGKIIREMDTHRLGSISLVFDDRFLLIEGGCSTFIAPYRLQGNRLTLGELARTSLECSDQKRTKIDRLIEKMMHGSFQYTLADHPQLYESKELRPKNTDGTTYRFMAHERLDHNERYEEVFIELDVNVAPCGGPEAERCLQVRELLQHDDGRLSPKGTWQSLNYAIKGYRHVPYQSAILLVQKVTPESQEIHGPEFLYYLDMIVERKPLKD